MGALEVLLGPVLLVLELALVARMVLDCAFCDSGTHVLDRLLRGGS